MGVEQQDIANLERLASLEQIDMSGAIELEEARAFSIEDIAMDTLNCRGSCSQSSNSTGCRSACTGSCSRCSGQ